MSTIINAKVRHKRGTEASIPSLLDGQIYLTTDFRKIYKGTSTGNKILFDDTELVKKTKGTITFYVNASSGLDTNSGLTSGTAFKTIQYAISQLPQIINHSVNINVASGTYTEFVTLHGFVGLGTINLMVD